MYFITCNKACIWFCCTFVQGWHLPWRQWGPFPPVISCAGTEHGAVTYQDVKHIMPTQQPSPSLLEPPLHRMNWGPARVTYMFHPLAEWNIDNAAAQSDNIFFTGLNLLGFIKVFYYKTYIPIASFPCLVSCDLIPHRRECFKTSFIPLRFHGRYA